MRYLVILVTIFPCYLYCQNFDYRFENYSSNDGLPYHSPHKIEQDNQGAIWIINNKGVAKYDGFLFESFSFNPLDSNTYFLYKPHDLLKLPDGNFLVINRNSVFHFDPIRLESRKIVLNEISNDRIFSACISKDSSIWLGTFSKGLFHYDKNFQFIANYHTDASLSQTLPFNYITKIFEDELNRIWVHFPLQGLSVLDVEQDTQYHFPFLKDDQGMVRQTSDTLNTSFINCFLQADKNTIWLGTNSSLIEVDISKKHFTHYRIPQQTTKNYYYSNEINTLFLHNNQLWCGTENQGIMIFDLNKREFSHKYNHVEYQSTSLSSNKVTDYFYSQTFEDGILWIGTGKGVSKLNLNQQPFELIYALSSNNRVVYLDDVRTIVSEPNHLWVGGNGTENSYLTIIDKKDKSLRYFSPDPSNPNTIGNGTIGSITKRQDGKYWITTWKGWLHLFDPRTDQFKKWLGYHNNLGLDSWVMCESVIDRKGNYWVGTVGQGLWKMPVGSTIFEKNYSSNPNGLPGTKVKKIFIDPDGPPEIIWLGTNNGLSKFDTQTETFQNFLQKESTLHSLPYNSILDIHKDRHDNFWLSMDNYGLLKFNLPSKKVKIYSMEDGLPSNKVFSAYEDKEGYLWLSTSNGLSKFDPLNEKFENYFKSDGLQANQFNYGAHFQDENGKLFFGGISGVTTFYPENIHSNPLKPKVTLTNLYIQNKKIKVGSIINGQVFTPQKINEDPKLILDYKTNNFSLEFNAINYSSPLSNSYKFKLVGYDQDWQYTNAHNRVVHYANLPTGTYTFLVLASNQNGIWGEEPYQITIEVLQPWWTSWWFSLLAIAVLGILISIYVSVRTYHLKQQKRLLEGFVAEKTNELKQVNVNLREKNDEILKMVQQVRKKEKDKTTFYSNISHEFRTPLTLIISPINQLINELNASNSHWEPQLLIVKRNAYRLLRLINQLLDFSELEAGITKLEVDKGDIVFYVKRIVSSFNYKAKRSGIKYNINCKKESFIGYFDHDKLEKILYNLLSNAFKFTERGGTIDINIHILSSNNLLADFDFMGVYRMDGHTLLIEVRDTGCGIPSDHLEKIFERFQQVAHPTLRRIGTGIGLSLTKQLIHKHKGQILVESQPELGSTFRFYIPIDKTHYNKSEIKPQSINLKDKVEAIEALDFMSSSHFASGPTAKVSGKPTLLLVEDSKDMQAYLNYSLHLHFSIITANEGAAGFELALTHLPDIILTDIMMPIMDGFDLCKRLKQEAKTSHIPIVVLTAKSKEEDKISALAHGADDIISKPFNLEILQLKLHNILDRKKRFQQHVRHMGFAKQEYEHSLTQDEQFLNKIISILEENLSNSNLNAELLAEMMSLSRSHLYKKIKSITGQGITEYIRAFRLDKAAHLLKQNKGNISEIAFQVGFNSPSYFSASFKKRFGTTPQEFTD